MLKKGDVPNVYRQHTQKNNPSTRKERRNLEKSKTSHNKETSENSDERGSPNPATVWITLQGIWKREPSAFGPTILCLWRIMCEHFGGYIYLLGFGFGLAVQWFCSLLFVYFYFSNFTFQSWTPCHFLFLIKHETQKLHFLLKHQANYWRVLLQCVLSMFY